MASPRVPDIRRRTLIDSPPNPSGDYILYWMIANRRLASNYSLDVAIEYSRELGKPLIVFEPLNCDYRWASPRFHAFVIQGMKDNAAAALDSTIAYYPYLEPDHTVGNGLLAALAARAAVVVSDDFPCFFHPALLRVATRQIPCRFEVVDSNGMLPMQAAPKVFARAFDFRRYLQKALPDYLTQAPVIEPLAYYSGPKAEIPQDILQQWPSPDLPSDDQLPAMLDDFPLDHDVPVVSTRGGTQSARQRLQEFIANQLSHYGDRRNDADHDVSSRLSPYLHFGHISSHEVFKAVIKEEHWKIDDLSQRTNGSAQGWWGMNETCESFLDELITWREIGYNMASKTRDYTRYESLPQWAQDTLAEHASDEREAIYSFDELEQSQTHDELWNAAQRQLVQTGRIHNYLRMLWGKNILKWSRKPQDALAAMIELNNKYALDGRNPNSYSGIFWVLGRYDRAWGPERPVFGKIRYMTSDNTARKIPVKNYLRTYGPDAQPTQATLFDS